MEVVRNLIPPTGGDDRVYRWRVFVACLVGTNSVAIIFHIFWACGWLAVFGLHGFALQDSMAKADDLADRKQVAIERKLNDTQLLLIQNAIKEALKIRCLSVIQNNQASLDSANRDLSTYEDQYYTITERTYPEPPCSVVLIAKIP